MSSENNNLMNALKIISSVLAILLPFAQFSFKLFKQIQIIFLDENIIFFTTVTTFFLSIFIIFVANHFKYWKHVNQKKQVEWLGYLRKIDPAKVSPEEAEKIPLIEKPTEKTLKTVALCGILLFFLTSSLFILVGVDNKPYNQWLIFLQAILYIFTFVNATFIISVFAIDTHDKYNWSINRKARIQKAINLAKENNGFKEFPELNFHYAKENFNVFPSQFIVNVFLDKDKEYRIVTDLNANILYAVNKEEKQKKEE